MLLRLLLLASISVLHTILLAVLKMLKKFVSWCCNNILPMSKIMNNENVFVHSLSHIASYFLLDVVHQLTTQQILELPQFIGVRPIFYLSAKLYINYKNYFSMFIIPIWKRFLFGFVHQNSQC